MIHPLGAWNPVRLRARWALLPLEAVAAIMATVVSLMWLAVTAIALTSIVAAWVIVTRILEISAVRMHKEVRDGLLLLLWGRSFDSFRNPAPVVAFARRRTFSNLHQNLWADLRRNVDRPWLPIALLVRGYSHSLAAINFSCTVMAV